MVVFSMYMVTVLPRKSTGVSTLKAILPDWATPSSLVVLEVVEEYRTTLSSTVLPSFRAESESVLSSSAHLLPTTTPSTLYTPYMEDRMVRASEYAMA